MEYIVLFSAIALIISAFIPIEKNGEYSLKFIVILVSLGFFAASICNLTYNLGVKDGAFNQLRGRYEVTYVIDKDSCIVDTIINIK